MFDLKKPCNDCPFIKDGHMGASLAEGRIEEIQDGLLRDQSFPCHKTVDYENGTKHKEQHCVGAMIYLYKKGRPNQMMRIAERCGWLKESDLKDWDKIIE
jgi:hypothetical protein